MREDWHAARWLKERLFQLSAEDEDLGFWAQKVQPPHLQDAPAEFFANMPTFDDPTFASLRFAPDHVPQARERLLTKPLQPSIPPGVCARSVFDLMPDQTARQIRSWLAGALADLVCMRDHGVDCIRPVVATARHA